MKKLAIAAIAFFAAAALVPTANAGPLKPDVPFAASPAADVIEAKMSRRAHARMMRGHKMKHSPAMMRRHQRMHHRM